MNTQKTKIDDQHLITHNSNKDIAIKLYGANHCHKTYYYQLLLEKIGVPYLFLDVEKNENHANELRDLYESRKLNFPTITIGKKKLRNPYKTELIKWLHKLGVIA